jgi:disulfide oxidoreductase YuzD
VAFLSGTKATTFSDDCKVMSCPIYTKLYHSILTEKYAPLKNAFKKFCIQAHYKQTMDKHSIEKALQNEIKQKLEDNQFYYKYADIDEIDLRMADIIKDKCFEQCATMYEKVQLQKYYYNLQFLDKEHEDVARAWDQKLFFFLNKSDT